MNLLEYIGTPQKYKKAFTNLNLSQSLLEWCLISRTKESKLNVAQTLSRNDESTGIAIVVVQIRSCSILKRLVRY